MRVAHDQVLPADSRAEALGSRLQTPVGGVRFAVVIPLHNKGPHIARALDSVLAQTRPPAEIIVVDDASSDDGMAVVAAYDDARIKRLHRAAPGPGGYAARNLAIEAAESAWIAFLDADDAWEPGHLDALAAAIAGWSGPGSLNTVFSGFHIVEPDGSRRRDPFSERRRTKTAEPIALDFGGVIAAWLEIGHCPVWTSATACRRAALIEAGLFPAGRCRRGGDKDLWLRLAAIGWTLAAPATTAIYYRDAINMVTRQQGTNTRHCLCDTIQAMLQTLPAGMRPRIRGPLRRLFNLEVFMYAMQAALPAEGGEARAGSGRLDPALWSGFFVHENPLRFLLLIALSLVSAGPAVRRLARHWRRLRRAG
jgi:GT2 family glycosyltransferase